MRWFFALGALLWAPGAYAQPSSPPSQDEPSQSEPPSRHNPSAQSEPQNPPPAQDDAPAQDEPPSHPEPEPIEVRVIGEKADAMQKLPGSGTVIRPREVERADPYDAAEMLRRVPGVHVRQDPGAGGRLDIGMRGLDPGRSRRVLVLEDGIPIANNPYGEPDLYWAPPVERWRAIEVVKGSGNILFGPQTVGGVINFITPFAPSRREARIEVKGGQRRTVQALGRYGDAYGPARYLAQILFRRGDGFRAQGFRTVDALGKVAFDTSRFGTATLKLGVHDTAADSDDIGLTQAMFRADPRRATLAPHDALALRRYDASLIHEHRFNDIATLRTLAYGYTLSRLWNRQRYDRFPVQGVAYERIVGDVAVPQGAIFFRSTDAILDRRYEVAGLEPRLELRFPTGAVGHTVDVGARVLGEAAHYEQREGERPNARTGALLLDEDRSSLAVAGYAQDRLAFFDEHLLVTPGIRVEHVRYRRHISREPTATGARDVDIRGSSHHTAIIPGIGMTAGTPDMHGFAGFHVGFAPPRATSSIRSNGASEQLDSERSLAYELGARLGQARLWRLEVTGFLSNFANQIVPSTSGATTELVNAGSTRHIGVESAATLSFGELIGHGVLLDLAPRYTFLRAEFVSGPNDGNALPYAPSHLLATALDVGHAIGVSGQLAYTFVGPHFADDANTELEDITGRTGLIEAYHLLDANLRYKNALTGLYAVVSIKNLLDRPFIISRRPEGIHVSGFRQIMLSVGWEYADSGNE